MRKFEKCERFYGGLLLNLLSMPTNNGDILLMNSAQYHKLYVNELSMDYVFDNNDPLHCNNCHMHNQCQQLVVVFHLTHHSLAQSNKVGGKLYVKKNADDTYELVTGHLWEYKYLWPLLASSHITSSYYPNLDNLVNALADWMEKISDTE